MENPRIQAIKDAAAFLTERFDGRCPEIGIILGSGLGSLGSRIQDAVEIRYGDIPGFPVSTAVGHKGSFLCGKLGNKCVLAMQGRFHYYEGYSMDLVTLPVRVMAYLGIKTLLVSNAAGGTNLSFSIGDLMVITDHINLIPNPLIGANLDEFGPRFPDMTCPYDRGLIKTVFEISRELDIHLQKGVYVATTGPCYETPAEYKFFRNMGADAVGMSTVPEVIVARHCGMKVFGISVITDLAHDDMPEDYITDENEIVAAADRAAGKMTSLFERLIEIC